MGELVSNEEEQIVSRDENSWLIDGATPREDVMRVLDVESFLIQKNYETISGFMMLYVTQNPENHSILSYTININLKSLIPKTSKLDQIFSFDCQNITRGAQENQRKY